MSLFYYSRREWNAIAPASVSGSLDPSPSGQKRSGPHPNPPQDTGEGTGGAVDVRQMTMNVKHLLL
ncbi:hypothetical protein NG799_13525 [Laspinema sp. D1]|uniref:Uncharacterized protein n=1 Tax=Laspinema palackyanum D2a TaxID=2953684 RepID=A0ABT2MVD2_9CYAN|nr:hypothetical protein [Laspinema sp. D2a]